MSDEQAIVPATETPPYGDKWGDDIPPERKTELDSLFAQQAAWTEQPEATRAESHFQRVRLTGADVFYLAARALAGLDAHSAADASAAARLRSASPSTLVLSALHMEGANLREAHLECADLVDAHLEGARLAGAHLEDANLYVAHLEGANLAGARLERAFLGGARLERADLGGAHLEGARLAMAHLEGANLYHTHLEGANLYVAHLERTNLREAHLERTNLFGAYLESADLREAHLGSADLREAHLEGADLREAFFDAATTLRDATLSTTGRGGVRVADARWGGVNLATVARPLPSQLGDEQEARQWKSKPVTTKKRKPGPTRAARRGHRQDMRRERLDLFEAAVRANRQFAVALQNQGMSEDAANYAYHAQVCQRTVLRLQRKVGQWLFSGFLDGLAGYGYQPVRTLIWYLVLIFGFAAAYWLVGPSAGHTFQPDGALVFSVTSFHGRGFFPGGLALENWLARLAALEAVIGLLIEISFIATFTQRYFGAK